LKARFLYDITKECALYYLAVTGSRWDCSVKLHMLFKVYTAWFKCTGSYPLPVCVVSGNGKIVMTVFYFMPCTMHCRAAVCSSWIA